MIYNVTGCGFAICCKCKEILPSRYKCHDKSYFDVGNFHYVSVIMGGINLSSFSFRVFSLYLVFLYKKKRDVFC